MRKQIIHTQKILSYTVTGTGFPVMLVHGFGEDHQIWDQQAGFLSTHFKCIIPDLPGSGLSELTEEVSMEQLAMAMHAIILHEKVTRFVMIGHSMGGYIALAYAAQYSNFLQGFGLFHSTAYADSDVKKEARQKSIVFIEKNGAFEFLKQAIPNLFSEHSQKTSPLLISAMIDQYKDFNPMSLIQYYRAMIERPDRTMVLKNVSLPILFICGKFDEAVPLKDMLQLSHLPDLSYIEVLENSGHMGMLEETEKSNQSLYHFITDIASK